MKNAVFTIVAKNYLSLAKSLMNSVRAYNPDCDLFVFVADEFAAGQFYQIDDCKIIECKTLDIPLLYDMAFKYNVTEFCTSVKPFCFDYLKVAGDYSNVIYFDPDVFLFDDVNKIFNDLGDKLCLLTPHYFTPEVNYTGVVPEEMILWVGILNLGFVAMNVKHTHSSKLIEWWKNRLALSCYADKQDGLHTDQKWMDYLPSYFPDDVVVSHNMGYNLSIWNLHERLICQGSNGYYVRNIIDNQVGDNKLVFIHFSGFDIANKQVIHKHHPIMGVKERPEMGPLLDMYRESLINNGYYDIIKWEYTYNVYDNGLPIILFHRRLYRRITELGSKFSKPFSTGKGSFFESLKNNHLTVDSNFVDKQSAKQIPAFEGKIKLILKAMKILSRVLGINKYSLLLKFLIRYSRPENQTFLIKEWMDNYSFYNENVKG